MTRPFPAPPWDLHGRNALAKSPLCSSLCGLPSSLHCAVALCSMFIYYYHTWLGVQNTDVYSESFTSSTVDLGPLSGVRSAPLTTEGAASSCVCLLRSVQSLWLCSAVELPRSTALTCRRQNPNRYSVGSFKTPTGFWPHGFDEAKTGTFVFSPA